MTEIKWLFPDGMFRLYPMKIWRGDELISDLVPCFRESDGKYGIYDKVNGKFIEVRYPKYEPTSD